MDKTTLLTALSLTAETMGTALSADALNLMAADLLNVAQNHDDLARAITKCRRGHKGRLTVAAIIEHLPNKPIGADAAWEMAMQLHIGNDEFTVVAPQAIMAAFPYALWNLGDKIAARMAFRDAWPVARETYGMGYVVSEGHDPKGREPAIMEALRNGLIPNSVAQQWLPHMAMEIAALAAPDVPLLAKGERA